MNDKDDGIFLWMLEQDRQRNKDRVLNKVSVESEEQLSSAARELIFSARNSEPEISKSLPDDADDLAQLLGEQADLKEESLRLDEEEKELSLRARALSEKVMQEITRRNDEKRKEISQLQAKINNMELMLGELSVPNPTVGNTVGSVELESAKPADSGGSPQESLDAGDGEPVVEIVEEVNDTRYRFSLKHQEP